MDDATAKEVTDFLDEIAERLIVDDFAGVAKHFAPWLDDPGGEGLQAEIETQIEETLDELDLPSVGEPDASELYDSDLGVEELRADTEGLPAEVGEANFVAWTCIAIRADEGDTPLYDLWCALVRSEGGLRIGYSETDDPS